MIFVVSCALVFGALKLINAEERMNFIRIISLSIILFCSGLNAQIKEKSIESVDLKSTKKKLKKKENPAYEILQEVWKRKKSNGLGGYKDFQFEEYEKIEVDVTNIDSAFTKKKIFKGLDFMFQYADSTDNGNNLTLPIYFNESVYKNFGKNNPKKEKRDIIANKSSGFSNNEVVANTAKNLYKEIDIYNNTLNFFNIGFTSPIARDGFASYDYLLLNEENI